MESQLRTCAGDHGHWHRQDTSGTTARSCTAAPSRGETRRLPKTVNVAVAPARGDGRVQVTRPAAPARRHPVRRAAGDTIAALRADRAGLACPHADRAAGHGPRG